MAKTLKRIRCRACGRWHNLRYADDSGPCAIQASGASRWFVCPAKRVSVTIELRPAGGGRSAWFCVSREKAA